MVYTAPDDIQNLVNSELEVLLKIISEEYGKDKAGEIRAKYKQIKQEEE